MRGTLQQEGYTEAGNLVGHPAHFGGTRKGHVEGQKSNGIASTADRRDGTHTGQLLKGDECLCLVICDVWFRVMVEVRNRTRDGRRSGGAEKIVNRKTQVVTCCFRMTNMGALSAEVDLQPTSAQLDNRQRRYSLRIHSLPESIEAREILQSETGIRKCLEAAVDYTGWMEKTILQEGPEPLKATLVWQERAKADVECHEPHVTGFSAQSPAPPSPQLACGSSSSPPPLFPMSSDVRVSALCLPRAYCFLVAASSLSLPCRSSVLAS
jgi:hypothetical protein